MMSNGLLIVFSGPSGAGKDTILKRLLEKDPNLRLSVSATTRPPRKGETDGKDYHFITMEKFHEMAENGEMLESAGYCGNFYGTPRKPIEQWLSEGFDVILEIEVQGGAQIQTQCPDCVGIFILPPSLKVLENRLRNRHTDSDEVIEKRLAIARDEIAQVVHYNYAVINDSVEQAADEIIHILNAEKHRVQRDNNLIERIFNNA